MSKSVISQSDELIRLQKHSKRACLALSILFGLVIFLIWFVYALLAAFGKGYYKMSSPFGTVTALAVIPYPDMNVFLFDFSNMNSIYRLIILGGVIIASVLTSFIFHHFYYLKSNSSYKEQFISLLQEEGKINGLIFDSYEYKDKESFEDTIHLLNVSAPEFKFAYQFSTGALSWVGRQFSYVRDSKRRDAFIISTDLTKARSHALIQLRTFGEPSIKQYGGLEIKKYGFGDSNGLENFICFSTLGQDIYLTIDKRAAKAISSLYGFVKSDLAVMIVGDRLTIFIDGFLLTLSQNLNKKLPNQVLEQETEALMGLHQAVTNLTVAFSEDISFGKEEKGNGITNY